MPRDVRRAALAAYRQWLADPRAGGLRFKCVGNKLYSLRIDDDFRAMARLGDAGFEWYFIGSHADYLRELRNPKYS